MKITGTKEELIVQLAKVELVSGKVYELELTDPDKRSLTANRYYWKMATLFARYEKRSLAYIHNDIMEHYGEVERVDGKPIWIVMQDNDRYKELSYIHLKPTSQVKFGEDGTAYRTYVKMQDSHTMTPKEFSRLIDGLIQEIKASEAPIETMTPRELAQLEGYEQ